MTHVKVKDGKVDEALKIFKQKFAKSGTPSEVKKRKYAAKPGVRRREEKEEMIKNARKRNRRNNY